MSRRFRWISVPNSDRKSRLKRDSNPIKVDLSIWIDWIALAYNQTQLFTSALPFRIQMRLTRKIVVIFCKVWLHQCGNHLLESRTSGLKTNWSTIWPLHLVYFEPTFLAFKHLPFASFAQINLFQTYLVRNSACLNQCRNFWTSFSHKWSHPKSKKIAVNINNIYIIQIKMKLVCVSWKPGPKYIFCSHQGLKSICLKHVSFSAQQIAFNQQHYFTIFKLPF